MVSLPERSAAADPQRPRLGRFGRRTPSQPPRLYCRLRPASRARIAEADGARMGLLPEQSAAAQLPWPARCESLPPRAYCVRQLGACSKKPTAPCAVSCGSGLPPVPPSSSSWDGTSVATAAQAGSGHTLLPFLHRVRACRSDHAPCLHRDSARRTRPSASFL